MRKAVAAGVEALGDHLLPHGIAGQVIVVAPEVVQLVVLASEQLGQQYARQGESLLGNRGNLSYRALGAGNYFAAPAPDPAGQQEENRQHRQGHQRELPRQEEHGHHHGDQRNDAGHGVGEGPCNNGLDAIDVVGHSGLHLTGAGAGEETQRHPQQVVVDGLLQVAGNILPHPAGEVRLDDTQRSANHHDGRDHPGQEPEQHQVQRTVGRKQRRVENLLDQHRVDHAQPSVDHYEQPNDGHWQLVRAQQPEDAAHQAMPGPVVELAVLVMLRRVRHLVSCQCVSRRPAVVNGWGRRGQVRGAGWGPRYRRCTRRRPHSTPR